jgi:hypothetical protein
MRLIDRTQLLGFTEAVLVQTRAQRLSCACCAVLGAAAPWTLGLKGSCEPQSGGQSKRPVGSMHLSTCRRYAVCSSTL